jgi:hypothetical protein
LRILPRPRLLISEILADPPAGMRGDANGNGRRERYGDEFVELLNLGTTPLPLMGLRLKDTRSKPSRAFSFPDGSVLPAGARVTVFGAGHFANRVFFAAGGRIGDGLGNRADSVFVIDPEGPDTLAQQGYELGRAPGESLCWDRGDSSPVLHSSFPGRDRHSPGVPRPVLRFAKLVPGNLRLLTGTSARLQVVGRYSDGLDRVVVGQTDWASSASDIVAVGNGDGYLTGIAPGMGEIRAHLDTFDVQPSHVTVKVPLAQQLTFAPSWKQQAIPEGRVLLFGARFSGMDRATYRWKRNGDRLKATSAGLAYRWSGTGKDTLEVEVGLRNEQVRRQWVLTANRPPTITAGDSVAFVGRLFTLQLFGFDAEGDVLAYTLESGPPGLALNLRTGRISWRPTRADIGSHELMIDVSDGFNNTRTAMNLWVQQPSAKFAATSPDPQLMAWPNPFSTVVKIEIRGAPPVTLPAVCLFDLTGQKLRTLPFTHLAGAAPSAVWNGRSDLGAQVGSGIYLAVVEINGARLVRKLLCLR